MSGQTYRGIDFLQERLEFNILKIRVREEHDFAHSFLVVQVIPKFSFEILEPHAEIISWFFEFYFVEILLIFWANISWFLEKDL
jgi:hypothetical protein